MNARLFIHGKEVALSNSWPMEQFTSFDQSVFEFCRDWQNGKSEFAITTSGSTGKPRTILLTRDQLRKSAWNTAKALSLKPGMKALVCLDPRYIAGMMMLVRCLEVGIDIICSPPSANPLKDIESFLPIDFIALTPYQLRAILDSPQRQAFNRVGTAIIGGGSIDSKISAELDSFQCQFYATYGMTETVSHIALQRLNGSAPQNYFIALPGVRLSMDDRQCLVIEADFIDTQRVVTNDMVDLKSPDRFVWLGRWDNVINTGGIKAHPEEIEKVIELVFSDLGIGNQFFVYGMPDQTLGHRITLIVEGELEYDSVALLQLLKEKFEPYKNPKEVLRVPRFIETETGKIIRSKTIEQIPSLAPPNRRSIG